MCDYSLMHLASRPAKVGDKLVTKQFPSGTTGLVSPDDTNVAVCCLPGTEIGFDAAPTLRWSGFFTKRMHKFDKVAIFRQVNKDEPHVHHDALEFPDGHVQLLNTLAEDLKVTVLQLPAAPRNADEAEEQRRVEVVA